MIVPDGRTIDLDTMKHRNHPLLILIISFAGSGLTAFVALFVLGKFLPPSDLAYGQSVFQNLSDPFVRHVFLGMALISGAITFPAAYFCLRDRNLLVAVPIVCGAVLLWVGLITPFSFLHAFLGAYLVLGGALLFCKFSRWERLAKRGAS